MAKSAKKKGKTIKPKHGAKIVKCVSIWTEIPEIDFTKQTGNKIKQLLSYCLMKELKQSQVSIAKKILREKLKLRRQIILKDKKDERFIIFFQTITKHKMSLIIRGINNQKEVKNAINRLVDHLKIKNNKIEIAFFSSR